MGYAAILNVISARFERKPVAAAHVDAAAAHVVDDAVYHAVVVSRLPVERRMLPHHQRHRSQHAGYLRPLFAYLLSVIVKGCIPFADENGLCTDIAETAAAHDGSFGAFHIDARSARAFERDSPHLYVFDPFDGKHRFRQQRYLY